MYARYCSSPMTMILYSRRLASSLVSFSLHTTLSVSLLQSNKLKATSSENEHKGNPNHSQSHHHDILPLALRQRVLLPVFLRMVTIDRRLAGHHPRRRLGPRHPSLYYGRELKTAQNRVKMVQKRKSFEQIDWGSKNQTGFDCEKLLRVEQVQSKRTSSERHIRHPSPPPAQALPRNMAAVPEKAMRYPNLYSIIENLFRTLP